MKLVSWLARGGFAVGDQVFFSGAHFFLNVLLARWLSPSDYGAFAIGYAVFYLVAGFHNALLLEPMLIFGSGRFDQRLTYFQLVMRGHFLLTTCAGLLILMLIYPIRVIYGGTVSTTFFWLGMAMPILLLFWTIRRFFYVTQEPIWAFWGSVTYSGLLICATYAIYLKRILSPEWAVAALTIAASGSTLLLLLALRSRLIDHYGSPYSFREFFDEHWRYGKWALASSLVLWIPLNIFYLVLPLWGDTNASGAFRALMNFVNPALQVIAALGLVLVPALVRKLRLGGFRTMSHVMIRFLALASIVLAAYLMVLLSFKDELFHLLYAGKYVEHGGATLSILSAVVMLGAFTQTLGAGIRALEQPKKIFYSYSVAAIIAIIVSVPLVVGYGILGASMGFVGSYLIIVVLMLAHYLSFAKSTFLQ